MSDYRIQDRENVTIDGRPMTAFSLFEPRPHPPATTPASGRRWRRSTDVPTMMPTERTMPVHHLPHRLNGDADARSGTAEIGADAFAELYPPNWTHSPKSKAPIGWIFGTPRGAVAVYRYWWNDDDELSVSGSRKATLWVIRYLRRRHGIDAHRMPYSRRKAALMNAGAP